MPQKQAKSAPSNSNAFKLLFGQAHLTTLGNAIYKAYPNFERRKLLAIHKQLVSLEMKPRIYLIRDTLRAELPEEFPRALKILLESVENEDLRGFNLWPITEFIQTYGLKHSKISLEALKQLTHRFTSEWAVRPFLKLDQSKTLSFLLTCAKDENHHIRRWASEGCRPRLPWGERLNQFIEAPKHTLRILEVLKYDDELYVRKSVANHLNDISKDHPTLVVETLTKWQRQAPSSQQNKISWIIARSLRTLIKAGDPEALRLIGVSVDAKIKLTGFALGKTTYKIGDRLEFSFSLESLSKKPEKLVIDYIIHYVRSNQNRSPKVFKLKNVQLTPYGSITIKKSHHLKAVTTRAHYPGRHLLEVQINGAIVKQCPWSLSK